MNAQEKNITSGAAEGIKINGIYEHYKGRRYQVLMLVYSSEHENFERWVVYQALYDIQELGTQPIFTQSLERFLEKVVVNGREIARFILLE